ncbi:MAG TPA: TetR/AcrR family transcriptional regulator [Acidimicrobiales bacterium]|nr:TetR/AcrR family transcriptional regulator [Acidimicrobiales bacterium]
MSAPESTAATKRPAPKRGESDPDDVATRQRVLDATIACILELGFYRSSTNEIARRAGVTWGVIQHYFGTRERLMVAVLQNGFHQFIEVVEGVHLEGDTVRERMGELVDMFADFYARPEYLADLQVLLSMDRDPRTSAEVRETMRDVAAKSNVHVRRLLREALGSAATTPDLLDTVFLVVRGFGLSQQLLDTMSYDAPAPKRDRVARQRRLLADLLVPLVEHLGGPEAP